MKCRWVYGVWPQFTVIRPPLKRETWTQAETEIMLCSNEGRGWDNALSCKGIHRLPTNLQG